MTSKEFIEVLSKFPDDYIISIDNVFGWEPIDVHNMVDPHLSVNSDFGQIEIMPSDGYRNPWHSIEKEGMPKEEWTGDGYKMYLVRIKVSEDTDMVSSDYVRNGKWELNPEKNITHYMEIPPIEEEE